MSRNPHHQFGIRIAALILLVIPVMNLHAKDKAKPPSEQIEFFELNIRPVLVNQCMDCHTGGEDAESQLALDSRTALLKGGEFGPAIVPGDPEESLLFQSIRRTHKELKMPPDSEDRVSEKILGDFEIWIEWGAPWPEETARKKENPSSASNEEKEITTTHWCFIPRKEVTPPEVSNREWSENPVDQFIFDRLQKENLKPASLASRETLIRRATFDLTGLPPTPEEVEEFLNDKDPDLKAFAKVIDRLLDSSAYGERWGRHWLDVARYADTQGDVGDYPIPNAYLYRNWVINALNEDLPYDQFLKAQLAGDILAEEEKDEHRARELKIATGFIAISRRFGNTVYDDQHLTIDDTIDTIGRGIMGVTLKCARCHDHKFDPMLATDYYGLYGIFESTRYPSMGASNSPSPTQLVSTDSSPESQQAIDDYWKILTKYQHQIRNHFRPWLKPTLKKYAEVAKNIEEAKKNNKPTEDLEKERQKLLNAHGGKFKELMIHGLDWLKKEKGRLASNPPSEMLYAVIDGKPHHAKIHRRGNPKNQGDVVPRQFINVISKSIPDLDQEYSGRKELAEWMTSPEHPLTARVIVNRLWYHHFGQGLVKTLDNFGVQGSNPSHPELLDYLANQFVENGWSLKEMHRAMMLTRVYRLASNEIPQNSKVDPENVYLWKYSRKRLDAESIRDSMLFVSGELDREQGGSHPFKPWYKKGYSLNAPFHEVFPTRKRSVYLMTQRLFKHPFIGLFNGPDTNETTGTRTSSSIPTQALYLMNSPFVSELAEAYAKRILSSGQSEKEQVIRAYKVGYGREPSETEVKEAEEFLKTYREQLTKEKQNDKKEINQIAWAAYSKVLLTNNEFFFVE